MTIERLLEVVGSNALSATVLFAAALVAQRFVTRPAIRHLLWLAVVVRLLLPPLLALPIPAPSFLAGPSPDRPFPAGDAAQVAAVVASRDFAPLPFPAGRAAAAPGVAEAPDEPAALHAGEPSRRTAPVRSFPWPLFLVIAQLGGAIVVLAIAVHRWMRFRRALGMLHPAPAALVSRVHALGDRIGVRRVPRVALTDAAVSPFLFPAPAATLVLPAGLLARLDDDERDALLAHELTHVRRGDPWIRPLELLAVALYWWFPLLPFARARLRAAEEAACDRDVLRALPGKARAYAEGLLKAIEHASQSGTTPALATGAAHSRELKERIMAMFHPAPRPALPRWRRALALAPLLAAVSLTPAWVQRDEAPAPPVAAEPVEPPLPPEMPAALRLRMSAPPAIPAPELLTLPTAPSAPSAPSALRRMTTAIPASEREQMRAELEHRRQQLAIQRELVSMHHKQSEMDTAYEKVARAHELASMKEQLEAFENSGQKREAEELRRELELASDQLERDAALRKVEALHGREQQELELETMAAELRHEEALLADDAAAIEKAGREVQALHAKQRKMDLEGMRLELERTRSELEAQQAAYERMLREVDQAKDTDEAPEADETAAGDGSAE